jgi:hypothetical protein
MVPAAPADNLESAQMVLPQAATEHIAARERVHDRLTRAWHKCALAKRLIPTPPQVAMRASRSSADGLTSRAYRFTTSQAVGIQLPPAFLAKASRLNGAHHAEANISISMYCSMSRSFFGNTWTSPASPLLQHDTGQPIDLRSQIATSVRVQFGEQGVHCYLHSSVLTSESANCLLVVEVVASVKSAAGVSLLEMGIGWGVMHQAVLEHQSTSEPLRCDLYMGSPRMLLFLASSNASTMLEQSRMAGASLQYMQADYPPLQRAVHLLNDNQIVGEHERIVGLAQGVGTCELLPLVTGKLMDVTVNLTRHVEERMLDALRKEAGNIQGLASRQLSVWVHNGHSARPQLTLPLAANGDVLTGSEVELSELLVHADAVLAIQLEMVVRLSDDSQPDLVPVAVGWCALPLGGISAHNVLVGADSRTVAKLHQLLSNLRRPRGVVELKGIAAALERIKSDAYGMVNTKQVAQCLAALPVTPLVDGEQGKHTRMSEPDITDALGVFDPSNSGQLKLLELKSVLLHPECITGPVEAEPSHSSIMDKLLVDYHEEMRKAGNSRLREGMFVLPLRQSPNPITFRGLYGGNVPRIASQANLELSMSLYLPTHRPLPKLEPIVQPAVVEAPRPQAVPVVNLVQPEQQAAQAAQPSARSTHRSHVSVESHPPGNDEPELVAIPPQPHKTVEQAVFTPWREDQLQHEDERRRREIEEWERQRRWQQSEHERSVQEMERRRLQMEQEHKQMMHKAQLLDAQSHFDRNLHDETLRSTMQRSQVGPISVDESDGEEIDRKRIGAQYLFGKHATLDHEGVQPTEPTEALLSKSMSTMYDKALPLSRALRASVFHTKDGIQSLFPGFTREVPFVDESMWEQIEFARELGDMLNANEFAIQFVAFSSALQSPDGSPLPAPDSIYCTFQFFNFPLIETERASVGAPLSDGTTPRSMTLGYPALLQSERGRYDGIVTKFTVDPLNMRPYERAELVRYLYQRQLYIDVWQGSSRLHLGVASVPLRYLLRQGREAVQFATKVDVLEHTPSLGGQAEAGLTDNIGSRRPLRGGLFLRCVCVGKQSAMVQPTANGLGMLDVVPSRELRVQDSAKQPIRVFPVDEKENNAAVARGQVADNRLDTRKRQRWEHFKQAQSHVPLPHDTPAADPQDRQHQLRALRQLQQRRRPNRINRYLHEHLTAQHTVYASFGECSFFQFSLKNPYNVEHTFTIHFSDPELAVITDPKTWRHHCAVFGLQAAVEDGLLLNGGTVFLNAHEEVKIPFRFFSDSSCFVLPTASTMQSDGKIFDHAANPIKQRTIDVTFRNQSNV